ARDEALLTDFGVAAPVETATGTRAGTLAYMAPEVIRRHVVPPAQIYLADVYSLAATLYHLVVGDLPFPGPYEEDFLAQVAAGLPTPDPRCTSLPEPLERVIRAGLAERPEDRPSLADFLGVLRGALNQLLADTLVPAAQRPGAVDLRLLVRRRSGQSS